MNANGTTERCARLGCERPPRDLFHRAHRDRDPLDGPRYCGTLLECHAYVRAKGGEA